jgi:hypothetical protein
VAQDSDKSELYTKMRLDMVKAHAEFTILEMFNVTAKDVFPRSDRESRELMLDMYRIAGL